MKDFTEESRRKQSNAKKGKPAKNRIKVNQYTKDGLFIKQHESFVSAAKYVNGISTAFSMLKRGRLKTYKGYIWTFEI